MHLDAGIDKLHSRAFVSDASDQILSWEVLFK